MDSPIQFKITLPLEKAEREDGFFIMGVAAGPQIDSQGERIHPSAISRFAEQINVASLPLKDWHARNTILSDGLGDVTKAWITENGDLGIEARLDDDHPTAMMLWKKLQKGKQYGLSVGGTVLEFRDEVEKAAGNIARKVRTFYNVLLDEVSVTTKPIYTPSLGTVMSKAIDEAESELVEDGEKSMAKDAKETPNQSDEESFAAKESELGMKVLADAAAADASETSGDSGTPPQEGFEEGRQVIPAEGYEPDKSVTPPVATEKSVSADDVEFVKRFVDMMAPLFQNKSEAAASQPVETTVTEKASDDDAPKDRLELALDEILARLTAIEDRTPEYVSPGVHVRKAEIDQIREDIGNMDAGQRLRFGLAAMTRDRR